VKTQILVVDDETSVRELLLTFLKDRGFSVAGAKDGHEALELAQKLKPQMIFLDIAMPGLNGIETLRRLRKETPESNVIMISGHADHDMALAALDLGAFDFIKKPFDLAYLQNVVLLKMTISQ